MRQVSRNPETPENRGPPMSDSKRAYNGPTESSFGRNCEEEERPRPRKIDWLSRPQKIAGLQAVWGLDQLDHPLPADQDSETGEAAMTL